MQVVNVNRGSMRVSVPNVGQSGLRERLQRTVPEVLIWTQ